MPNNQYDQIENLDGALVQHGSYNHRIYLMNIGSADPAKLVSQLIALAKTQGYSKIFAKIPASQSRPFIALGFRTEARIPLFYHGTEEALFLGYYLNNSRQQETQSEKLDNIVRIAQSRSKNPGMRALADDCQVRRCVVDDVPAMANIYRIVFPTYPFPIHDPSYLRHTMQTHVEYFGVAIGGQLVALSSAEIDLKAQNAELTDFATLPQWRGHGFACHLLSTMQQVLQSQNIRLGYTIARAVSMGMNITFAKLGYIFSGRLINNTNISGHIESMNVWYKTM